MILQALNEYYQRKASDPDSGIAPQGFEYKGIDFILLIDPEGALIGIEDNREIQGKKRIARSHLVPQGVIVVPLINCTQSRINCQSDYNL